MKYIIALVLIVIYYESSIRLGLYDTEKIVIETIVKEQYITPDDGRDDGFIGHYLRKDGIVLKLDLGLWKKVNPLKIEPKEILIHREDEITTLHIEQGYTKKVRN